MEQWVFESIEGGRVLPRALAMIFCHHVAMGAGNKGAALPRSSPQSQNVSTVNPHLAINKPVDSEDSESGALTGVLGLVSGNLAVFSGTGASVI